MPNRRLPLVLALGLLLSTGTVFASGKDISKVNGSIVATAGAHYGDVDTVNGSITLEPGTTVADAETVNGSIRAGNDSTADALSTVNGSIRAGERVAVRGSVETVNGSIFIDRGSRVGKGASTVNGAIGLVDTDLDGGIETVNGDITVGVGSHVKGGITVTKPSSNWFPVQVSKRKPRIIVGPDAVVEGELKFEREVSLYVHSSARVGKVTGATAISYDGTRAPAE